MADQHSEPIPGGMDSPMENQASTRGAIHRPGMVTFAAVMMFLVAGFEALSALLAFAGTGWWVTDAGNLVYANFVLWGIVDTIIALIALYAGIDLLTNYLKTLTIGYHRR
jgi:predicted exporter